jgi:hypothetical protein
MRTAYIQNGFAAGIVSSKVPEAALAKKSPQWHLKLDWIHTLSDILKESAWFVLSPELQVL